MAINISLTVVPKFGKTYPESSRSKLVSEFREYYRSIKSKGANNISGLLREFIASNSKNQSNVISNIDVTLTDTETNYVFSSRIGSDGSNSPDSNNIPYEPAASQTLTLDKKTLSEAIEQIELALIPSIWQTTAKENITAGDLVSSFSDGRAEITGSKSRIPGIYDSWEGPVSGWEKESGLQSPIIDYLFDTVSQSLILLVINLTGAASKGLLLYNIPYNPTTREYIIPDLEDDEGLILTVISEADLAAAIVAGTYEGAKIAFDGTAIYVFSKVDGLVSTRRMSWDIVTSEFLLNTADDPYDLVNNDILSSLVADKVDASSTHLMATLTSSTNTISYNYAIWEVGTGIGVSTDDSSELGYTGKVIDHINYPAAIGLPGTVGNVDIISAAIIKNTSSNLEIDALVEENPPAEGLTKISVDTNLGLYELEFNVLAGVNTPALYTTACADAINNDATISSYGISALANDGTDGELLISLAADSLITYATITLSGASAPLGFNVGFILNRVPVNILEVAGYSADGFSTGTKKIVGPASDYAKIKIVRTSNSATQWLYVYADSNNNIKELKLSDGTIDGATNPNGILRFGWEDSLTESSFSNTRTIATITENINSLSFEVEPYTSLQRRFILVNTSGVNSYFCSYLDNVIDNSVSIVNSNSSDFIFMFLGSLSPAIYQMGLFRWISAEETFDLNTLRGAFTQGNCLLWVGRALNNASVNQPLLVQLRGNIILDGFTGLKVGDYYYKDYFSEGAIVNMEDSVGLGDFTLKLGMAISPTQIATHPFEDSTIGPEAI